MCPFYPASGSALTYVEANLTTGDIALGVAGAWTAVDATTDLVVPAAAGDRLLINFDMLCNGGFAGVGTGLDVATIVAGAPVNYVSSRGAAPATNGLPGLYTDPTFLVSGGSLDYIVQAGDISGGNVTLQFQYNNTAAGRIIYASANYPFRWRAVNIGQ